jgi:TonB-linked SusC/RagA family outer membrane protein
MKKNYPFREMFYRSLKKSVLTVCIFVSLMILGILQANAVNLYSVSEYLTEMSDPQQLNVTGTVTDSGTGQSMPGVNIVVQGTQLGAITDANGKYSITVPTSDATLVFTFIGYGVQEVPVAGKSVIDVALVSDLRALEEVVVIGYGTQKKVNVIGSVTTVSSEEIATAPVSMISNAIAGRMPGAIVQQPSGEPGHDASIILIRGTSTLGNNAPLIVVDGVADRDMNSIQPSDIESITVLKDASAGIYGARAANGVILITTKRGKLGTPATFSYGFYQGMLAPTLIPEMANAAEYAQMIREVQSYRGVDESNMMFSLEDIEKYKSGLYPWTHPNTDWYAETLKKHSNTSSHTLSVSGGTQAVSYYGSFGYKYDDAIYKVSSTYYKRYNLKATIDAKVNQYLSFGVDMNGSLGDNQQATRDVGQIFEMTRRQRPTQTAFFPNGLPGPDIEYGDNPVVISGTEPGTNKTQTYRINSTISATLKIPGVQGLTLSAYYAYDKYFRVQKMFQKPFTLYSLNTTDYLNAGNDGSQDGSAFLVANFPKGPAPEPRVTDYYDDSDNKVFNAKLNYDKTFGNHNVSAFVSMESMDYLTKGITAFRRYFVSAEIPYLFAGSTTDWSNNGSVGIDSRLNYFGRFMYNFKETYLFQFSLRRDGSLRFSEEKGRWGTFPSVLVGWRMSNEDFWKNNISFINYFKLKASFGQMGNDAVAAFQYLTSYAFSTGATFGDSKIYYSGLAQSGNPNPDITWEKANILNGGFESSFLNSKMFLNLDLFYQRRSQILVARNASVPGFTGIGLPDENFGIVDNRGFEIVAGFNDRSGNFSYDISGNLAYAANKVIEYDEPERNVEWQVRTGHPNGVLLLYKSIGIFDSDEEANSLPHVPGARGGDIIIEDYDNDGLITANDQILFDQTTNPKLTFGLGVNLSYKSFSVRTLFQGTGTYLRSVQVGDDASGTEGNYYKFQYDGRWTPENPTASKPRPNEMEEEYWMSNYLTDYNFQKGGYCRLKNIQISYDLPQKILSALTMKEAQVYVSGQNVLLLWTQNKIVDPEAGDMESYPIMKTFTIGARIAF